jgi:hypothetical protein
LFPIFRGTTLKRETIRLQKGKKTAILLLSGILFRVGFGVVF